MARTKKQVEKNNKKNKNVEPVEETTNESVEQSDINDSDSSNETEESGSGTNESSIVENHVDEFEFCNDINTNVWDVEKVLNKKITKKDGVQYLLKWSVTWIPLNLEDQKRLDITPQSRKSLKNGKIEQCKWVHEVEGVLGRCELYQTEYFKIKWKDSWRPTNRLNCPKLVKEYEEAQNINNKK